MRAPDRALLGACRDGGHILAAARDVELRPGGPRSISAPRRVREVGAHSPDRLERVPRPKLSGNLKCARPQAREHAKPGSHRKTIDAPWNFQREPTPLGSEVLEVADRQDPGGSDSWTNLSAWSRVDVYGAAFGEVWAELDGLALPSRCVTVLGARRPGGHGFPPGRRLADRRMGERGCCLGRPVVASSRGAVSARAFFVRAPAGRSVARFLRSGSCLRRPREIGALRVG